MYFSKMTIDTLANAICIDEMRHFRILMNPSNRDMNVDAKCMPLTCDETQLTVPSISTCKVAMKRTHFHKKKSSPVGAEPVERRKKCH